MECKQKQSIIAIVRFACRGLSTLGQDVRRRAGRNGCVSRFTRQRCCRLHILASVNADFTAKGLVQAGMPTPVPAYRYPGRCARLRKRLHFLAGLDDYPYLHCHLHVRSVDVTVPPDASRKPRAFAWVRLPGHFWSQACSPCASCGPRYQTPKQKAPKGLLTRKSEREIN